MDLVIQILGYGVFALLIAYHCRQVEKQELDESRPMFWPDGEFIDWSSK